MNPFKLPPKKTFSGEKYFKSKKNEPIMLDNNVKTNTFNKSVAFKVDDFPDLFLKENESMIQDNKIKNNTIEEENYYSKILEKQKIKKEENDLNDILPEGWISFKLNKQTRKIESKYNPSKWAIRENAKNKNSNNIMNDIVKTIEKNSFLYRKWYDHMNGEGAYEELYKPNYCFDFDVDLLSDSDSDTDNDYFNEFD